MTQAIPKTSEKNPTVQRLLFIGKICFVGLLVILMNIPMFMVQSLIDERNQRRDSADWEVVQTWGREQVLQGPILTVPYLVDQEFQEQDAKGNTKKRVEVRTEYAHFLPEDLQVTGKSEPEIRHRGIFKVPLYRANLTIRGGFLKPDFASLKISEKNILWEEARLSVGIPDMRAIQEPARLKFLEQSIAFEPGNPIGEVFPASIRAPVRELKSLLPGQEIPFAFELKLAGSKTLQFLPLGKQTEVALHSPWTNPSFMGAYLPTEREIGERGFSAHWKVLHLGRNYPQQWLDGQIKAEALAESAFGVSLLLPVDTYQMTTRSAKYAILFILLTFVTFFLFEVFMTRRIHPIQYLLVGFSLCLFYLLLLSLAEHLPFARSYLVASLGTIATITGYSLAVLKSGGRALVMGAILGVLYGYLYILLQLQDYALLLGSVGLFAILGLIMFITRKVDWYTVQSGKSPEPLTVTAG